MSTEKGGKGKGISLARRLDCRKAGGTGTWVLRSLSEPVPAAVREMITRADQLDSREFRKCPTTVKQYKKMLTIADRVQKKRKKKKQKRKVMKVMKAALKKGPGYMHLSFFRFQYYVQFV
jgi:hypothetical protein